MGKPGADRRKGRGGTDLELYDPSVSLLSRVVKVERRVTLIDRKLDMLIEMYREERHAKNAAESRSDDRDDSHESELDTAPKGFANRRRAWSPNAQRQGSGHQRTESTDTSSATSPADPNAPTQPKLSSSHPSLNVTSNQDSLTQSQSHQEFPAKEEPSSQTLIQTADSSSVQDNVFVVDNANQGVESSERTESTERTAKEHTPRSALRRKKPLRGGPKGSPTIQAPQSADSVTPSGDSTVSFGSTGSLQNPDGETRI